MPEKVWLGNVGVVGDYGDAANWAPVGVPVAADDVIVTGTISITLSLDQSTVAVESFVVRSDYTGLIGSVTGALILDPNTFAFNSGVAGLAFIDLQTGATVIDPLVRNTAPTSVGLFGLNLTGDNIGELAVNNGNVAVEPGTIIATVANLGGNVTVFCPLTSGVSNLLGTTTTEGPVANTVPTLQCDGGVIVSNSAGLVSLAQSDGGLIDFTQSPVARTVTDMDRSGSGLIRYQTDVVTSTNPPTSRGVIELSTP